MKTKLFLIFSIILLLELTNAVSAPVSTPPADKNRPYVVQVGARTLEQVKGSNVARAGDIIFVQIAYPKEFVDERPADRNNLVLYAGEVELKGISSVRFNKISKENFKTTDTVAWIPFELKRDSTTKPAWDYLYKLTDKWYQNKLKVNLTVGWEGMLPVMVPEKNKARTEITIVLFDDNQVLWMSGIYVVLIFGLSVLMVYTSILKDQNGVFSLSQTQLAFWTILIIGGFIYSLLLTEIPTTLNASVLILLGVSITSNGTANWIDFKKPKDDGTHPPKKPVSFIVDILSDGNNNISIQRFQNLAWTVVLGLYYVTFTMKNKTMPVIPDTLLYLTGISTLSYIAGKPTEPVTAKASN